MTNFVLIYTAGSVPESDEEMGAAIVNVGNPFDHSRHVGQDGTGDGPVSAPPATGYTIISAEALDAAVHAVQGHPHINHDGQVSVYETFQM